MSRRTGLLTRTFMAAALVGCHGKQVVDRPWINTEKQVAWDNRSGGEYEPRNDPGELNPADFAPRTVRAPATREKWELSLEEAKRIALISNKQIAFLKYQPAQAGT